MRFTIFQESRKGARDVNQDRIAYTYSRETLLLVVADGMGGHLGGEIAAQIRRLKPPEPYEGTGVRYAGEHIIKKAGKAAAGATGAAGAGGAKK